MEPTKKQKKSPQAKEKPRFIKKEAPPTHTNVPVTQMNPWAHNKHVRSQAFPEI